MRISSEGLLRKLLGSKLKNRILQFLVSKNAPVSERQLAQILGVSHVAVNKAMKELLEYNVVKATSIGSALIWQINERSAQYRLVHQYLGLQKKSSRDLVLDKATGVMYSTYDIVGRFVWGAFLMATSKKPGYPHLPKIEDWTIEQNMRSYLVGSVVDGTTTTESDIDLIVISGPVTKNFLNGEGATKLDQLKIRFMEEVGNHLSIQVFTEKEIETQPELRWVQKAIEKSIKVYP